MIRIYISTPDIETLHDIEDRLEDAGIENMTAESVLLLIMKT